MPYKSKAQEKYFNANRDKIGAAVVDEFNAASKGKKLPNKAPNKLRSEVHEYDHKRPKKQVQSRYKG